MPSSRPERSPTVLVVDDEEQVRYFVSTALRLAGYEVTVASSGLEALAVAESSPPFEMLVTDLSMPGMAGDEVARQLRRQRPALKVLYLTGHADHLFAERLTLSDGEAFLDKPCEVAALFDATSLLMGRQAPPLAASNGVKGQPASPNGWRGMTRRDDWS
jgi:CheY-like chemotaxis protein